MCEKFFCRLRSFIRFSHVVHLRVVYIDDLIRSELQRETKMFLKRSDLLLARFTLLSSIRLMKYEPVATPVKPDEPGV